MSSIRVHATNINGVGAVQLFASLYPELAASGLLQKVYVSPAVEAMARLASASSAIEVIRFDRWLPRAVSRLLECTIFARQFRGDGAFLVLGDIPLRKAGPQVVLVHSAHMLNADDRVRQSEWKYILSRAVFSTNARYVAAFVVQSEVMRAKLEATYPPVRGRVHVIPQPPPEWVIRMEKPKARSHFEEGLNLFYPAANYPHKNHALLRQLEFTPALTAAVKQIAVTLSPSEQTGLDCAPIRCVGRLEQMDMIRNYQVADALLFLSRKESYGFPLLEAMWLGLPILCPNLPYARWMCGPEAVYFDPDSPVSLNAAIIDLHRRLSAGWRPNWATALEKIPTSWGDCAGEFLTLCEQTGQSQKTW